MKAIAIVLILFVSLATGFQLPDLSGVQAQLRSLWLHVFPPDPVVVVDASNFDSLVQSAEVAVINFYAPGCTHCQRLYPEYRKAAGLLANRSAVFIGKVDASNEANKLLVSKYRIKKYPTIKIFRQRDLESPSEHSGAFFPEELALKWQLLVGPVSTQLAQESDWRALRDDSEVLVVGVFPKAASASATALQHFIAVAEHLRSGYRFAHTEHADIIPECKTSKVQCSSPAVLLYKPTDGGLSVYEGDFETEGLIKWVISRATPLVSEIRSHTRWTPSLREVYYSKLPRVLGITNQEHETSVMSALKSAAEAIPGMKFLMVGGNVTWLLNLYGIQLSDLPTFLIVDQQNKYIKTHFKAEECLAEWIREYEEDALPRYYKSEVNPPHDSGRVKHVTANTFEQMVFSGNNVLLELYRPNCVACHKFEKQYEEVAKQLQSLNMVVAKLNIAANDVPSDKFETNTVPAVFLVVAETGSVLRYGGYMEAPFLVSYVTGVLGTSLQNVEPQTVSAHEEL